MILLTVEDLVYVAERTLGEVLVRDLGLLEAAAARPRASAFGEDASPFGADLRTLGGPDA